MHDSTSYVQVRGFSVVSTGLLVASLLLVSAPAAATCSGDWLVHPTAEGEDGAVLLHNFLRLLDDLTHVGDEFDQYAVHRVDSGEAHLVTAPWFTYSTICSDQEGALRKKLEEDSEVLIENPDLQHYLMVTDELSELAWAVSLGRDQSLMEGIDASVLAMESSLYSDLPCWLAEVDETASPPIACLTHDTATDATVRFGLAYYNAANNPHFSDAARTYFRGRGDLLAQRHLAVEYLHETHTSRQTDREMHHWVAAGGDTAGSLSASDMYIGYYPDIALFLLAAHASTGISTYLERAADVVDQWVSANSFDGATLSLGPKRFKWVADADDDNKLFPQEVAPWDESDAPRALWMGHVLRAHQLATAGAPFPDPYLKLSQWVQLLLATDTQTPTYSCIEYFPDGTPKANCGNNYYYHGLSIGLVTFHNVSWLQTKLLDALRSYSWAPDDGKYWDFTDCFGIYRPIRPLKALAVALGLDAATYGGQRPKLQFLEIVRTGAGMGFVRSEPPGIDCGTACVGVFCDEELVPLIPREYEGSSFGGWMEAGCSAGSVTLYGDTTCTAIFNETCDPSVDLQAQDVDSTEVFAGCDELRAGNGFHVVAGGDVMLRAGGRIVLYDGFAVKDGGSLTAYPSAEP